ncbi:hypothetical protein NDU88_004412 [Pleurodeles waltl]|uniref:Uncharacterized protein n=1 Tax=Pleurodeles waltl TaxID=8319 RepID=A0AAV7TRS9_PLEWA|nr:hypothetical protein NDU88_004412 [Pleurodeles waltl]
MSAGSSTVIHRKPAEKKIAESREKGPFAGDGISSQASTLQDRTGDQVSVSESHGSRSNNVAGEKSSSKEARLLLGASLQQDLVLATLASLLGRSTIAGYLKMFRILPELWKPSSPEISQQALETLIGCVLKDDCNLITFPTEDQSSPTSGASNFKRLEAPTVSCPAASSRASSVLDSSTRTTSLAAMLQYWASFQSRLASAFSSLPEALSQRLRVFWEIFQLSVFPLFESYFITVVKESVLAAVAFLTDEMQLFIPIPALGSQGQCTQQGK